MSSTEDEWPLVRALGPEEAAFRLFLLGFRVALAVIDAHPELRDLKRELQRELGEA